MSEFLQSLKEKLGDSKDVNFEEIEQLYSQDINGLKTKNNDLINQQKKIKDQLTEMEGKFSSIDVNKYQEVMGQWDEIQKSQQEKAEADAKAKNDWEFFKKQEETKYKKASEQWTKKEQELAENLNKVTSKLHNKLIDLNLTKELNHVNVDKDFISFVKAKFESKAFVGHDEEGNEQVMIREGNAEVSVKDFISAWSNTDEAKKVISEPSTVGTGSKGSSSSSASRKQLLIEQYNEALAKRDVSKAFALQSQIAKLS